MTFRILAALTLLAATACTEPSELELYCDGVEDEAAQLDCLDDATEQARLDLDGRVDREADRSAEREREDRVRDIGERAHRDIDRLHRETRRAVRERSRSASRSRHIRRGLADIQRIVERADEDARGERGERLSRDERDTRDDDRGRDDDDRGRDDDDRGRDDDRDRS